MPKCKLIVCNRNGSLTGIVAERTGKSGQCLISIPDGGTERSNGFSVVVAVAAFSNYACFELILPQTGYSELTNLLKFELPRRVPYPAAEMTVFCRKFSAAGGKQRVRVFAVKTSEWNGVLETLQGVKLDAIVHPFMALPADLDSPVYLPEFEPDYLWCKDSDLWEMRLKDDDEVEPAGNRPASIAEYALSAEFQRDKKYLSALPPGLQIQRYRCWKIAAAILAVFAVLSAVVLGYLHIIDRRNVAMAVQREVDEAGYRLEYLTQALEQSRAVSETAAKILDGLNDVDPLPVMAQLTRSLPDTAWITSFRTGNGDLAVTLSVSGNTEPVNTALNQLPGFAMDSLRQQTNPDGSATLYVTLKQAGGVQ
ncbi:hypothetical protein [Victivallis sp. Marseille-Q1083]|uniref:hypothetical protein n=1 Tax=Victivallis sp. Marseille-Q1083 TaxID=2717288 RepID=UPI00158C86F3|nr:hypothetical protein [Victivallis sp. Marseille-Q1083]